MPVLPDETFDSAALLRWAQAEPLGSVLAWLNARAPFRFSAFIQTQDGRFETRLHHDRLGLSRSLPPMPPEGSYFERTLREDGFAVTNSLRDGRLLDSPWRKLIRAYHGVPATRADGRTVGVLCHYDVLPHELDESGSRLLRRIADAIAGRIEAPDAP